jgi:hypothetical protein
MMQLLWGGGKNVVTSIIYNKNYKKSATIKSFENKKNNPNIQNEITIFQKAAFIIFSYLSIKKYKFLINIHK